MRLASFLLDLDIGIDLFKPFSFLMYRFFRKSKTVRLICPVLRQNGLIIASKFDKCVYTIRHSVA